MKPKSRRKPAAKRSSRRARPDARKKAKRNTPSPAARPRRKGVRAARLAPLRNVPKQGGWAAALFVVEAVEGVTDRNESVLRWQGGGGGKKGLRVAPGSVRAFAAVGHQVRARLMLRMLDGPMTYRALQRATGLKAGPLYYHINELRVCGLILPKQRDLYELSCAGRNLTLVLAAVAPLLRNRRRRPVPKDK